MKKTEMKIVRAKDLRVGQIMRKTREIKSLEKNGDMIEIFFNNSSITRRGNTKIQIKK